MELLDRWPYYWFGVWKEYGSDYLNYPSIQEFIKPEIVKNYPMNKLKAYLMKSQTVMTTTADFFLNPFTKEVIKETVSYKTDGKWIWLDDLPFFIENYNVAIPTSFLKNIEKNAYKPVKWEGDFKSLNWPPNLT